MATITSTIDSDGPGETVTWSAVTTGDTGSAFTAAGYVHGFVTFAGTFNGGTTVILQGSNDGTTWAALENPNGDAISATAAGGFEVRTGARYVRPSVSSGSADSVNVVLHMKRARGLDRPRRSRPRPHRGPDAARLGP